MDDETELAACRRLCRLLPGERVSQSRVVLEGVRGISGEVRGKDMQSAGLARPDLAEIVSPCPEACGDRPQVLCPLRMSHPRPGAVVKGVTRCSDRARDIGRLRLGDAEIDLFCPRVYHVDHRAGRGLHPFAANEEPVRIAKRRLDLIRQAHFSLTSVLDSASLRSVVSM